MKIYQSSVTTDPLLPQEIATKQYVDQRVGTGSGIVGGVFITDISPTSAGIVGDKQYVPNTIPANRIITQATADTTDVRVSLLAEGGSTFYSPTVTVTTSPPQLSGDRIVDLTEDQYDKRLFSGYVDLSDITVTTVVTATSSTGAVAQVTINVAEAGPVVSSATIGALPGSQTEAKNNDLVTVSGVVANSATYVEAVAGAAVKSAASLVLGAADSGGQGFKTFTGTFTVHATNTGSQRVIVRARNALGTYGVNTLSGNSITLNQTFPTIGARTITYPSTQSAIKGTETATVSATVTNADTVAYTTSADLTVTAPNTYATVKTVTRAGGNYVVGTQNYTITATKASNAAVSTATAAVSIANTAPTATIAIVGSPTRLTSTPSGLDYTVRITPSQTLNAAPTLVASSGTWQGNWTLSAGVYSRVLRIADADVDGPQTFNTLVMKNIANVNGTTITSGSAYTVGGFARRTLTFAPFSQVAAIGTPISDFMKVTAKYAGSTVLTARTDTSQYVAGFTITNADGTYNPNGAYLFLTDADFAGSNTSGTLQVEIEEVA